MRARLISVATLMTALAALLFVPAAGHAATDRPVAVRNNYFEPKTTNAVAGDTVTWTFVEGSHNAVSYLSDSSTPAFNSGVKSPPTTPYTITFNGGTIFYRCTLHSSVAPSGACSGMCGVITSRPGTQAPTTPVVTSPANGASVGQPVNFTGTGEKWSTIEIREGATLLTSSFVNTNGDWSATLFNTSQGSHTYSVKAVDVNGVSSGTVSVTVTQTQAPADLQNPFVRIEQPFDNTLFTGPQFFKGYASDDIKVDRIELLITAVSGQTTTVPAPCFVTPTTTCGGTFSRWQTTLQLTAGIYTVIAKAYDGVGKSAVSPPVRIIVVR